MIRNSYIKHVFRNHKTYIKYDVLEGKIFQCFVKNNFQNYIKNKIIIYICFTYKNTIFII